MKEERILNVLGKVDEKYIKEADPEVKVKSKAPVWTKWAAMAACLCLVLVGVFVAPNFIGEQDPQQWINKINAEETYPEAPGSLEVIYKSMDELVADADMIVRISVNAQKTEVLDGYRQVHTSVTINDIYKGNLKTGDSVNIVEEAGQDGKVLGGIPVLNSDYEYILFLTEYKGNYYPCGAYQGRFILREGYLFQQATEDVKLGTYTPMTVENFIAEILNKDSKPIE